MTTLPFRIVTALKVMAPLTLPSPEGHWAARTGRHSQMDGGNVSRILQRLRAYGWVRDAAQGAGDGRRSVELTDEGRRFFEFMREAMFPAHLHTVSPEILFPLHARQHRDLGPPPDAAWVARAVAWQEAERQALREVERVQSERMKERWREMSERRRLRKEALVAQMEFQMAQIAEPQAHTPDGSRPPSSL